MRARRQRTGTGGLTRNPMWLALALSLLGTTPSPAQQQPSEPFTPAERWSRYLHRTYGPTRLGLLSMDTAIDHAFGDPGCWDSAFSSYGRRYARAFERRVIRNSVELAAGLLTGEDLRYRPSGSHTLQGRIWAALRASVIARMPGGTERPAYTRFFASEATDLSTTFWTRQPIRPGWMLQSAGWTIVSQAETNLLDEFSPDLRRIGLRVFRRIRPQK